MQNVFPDRLPTGIKKQTIMVPKGYYFGHPDDFEFARQTANYVSLKAVLQEAGHELTLISACPRRFHDDPSDMRQMRFVAIAGDLRKPVLIWEKYEGESPMGAQNRVYVDGVQYKLSSFLAMDELRRAMALYQP